MSRTLKDMTLEELWQLFPIVLTPHRPQRKIGRGVVDIARKSR